MTSSLDKAARSLIARFRSQRPLRGGSLLVTIFGDSIAPRGGAISLGSLIQLAQPFGLTERLVRTSAARLAQEDWLASRRSGAFSEYSLSANGQQRFTEATRRIYGMNEHAWRGQWTLVALCDAGAAERQRLRQELQLAGFGEPSAGLFAHPTFTPAEAREQLQLAGSTQECLILEATADDAEINARMVSSGWDLADLGVRYRRFVRAFEAVHQALQDDAPCPPATGFAIRTLLIHEYRKIHLRDPLLPKSLLPADWIGGTADKLCRDIYAPVFAAAETHLASVGVRLDGALPVAKAETYRRFGGFPRHSGG